MFLPLRDENPSGKFAVVNISLLLINIAVFFYELTLTPHAAQAIELTYGVIPARIPAWLAGHGTLESALLPFLTSMFLHGGLAHILGNMLFLWIFGDNVEAAFGHVGYLLFYLVCGIGSGLVHAAFNLHSHLPAVGASGAISGVLGAYIVLEPRNRILSLIFVFVVRVPAVIVLGVWFAMQFLMGLSTLGAHANVTGGVAVWAHIGGFVIGLFIALAVKRR
jgi:membrane associated rhomboid family serine protease